MSMASSRFLSVALLLLFALTKGAFVSAADPPQGAAVPPEKYVLNYPSALQFCPPVESYFDDVNQTIQDIRGHLIRHPLGGGYGLPVVLMIGDRHLLHLGADVSWMRPGAPVYAIGNGVVRISMSPTPDYAQLRSGRRSQPCRWQRSTAAARQCRQACR
jgi:hypothetical protein